MTLAIVVRRQSHHRYMAAKPSCFYCGALTFYMFNPIKSWGHTKDHVFPKSLRKKGASGATVPCCVSCNQKKGTMRPGDFIKTKVDPSRWPVINWSLLQSWGKRTGQLIGWTYQEKKVKPQMIPYHRFSNRAEVREEINFSARHEWMPQSVLNLPIPMALQLALVIEVKSAIQEVR